MFNNKLIICPKCLTLLFTNKELHVEGYAILSCECDEYPMIAGVIYMKKTGKKKTLNYLKHNKFNAALVNLISFSLRSRIFFKLTLNFNFIYKLLGFRNFFTLLSFFSLSEEWVKYLKKRQRIPSFFLSLFSLGLIKKKNSVLVDLCTGTGNLLPFVYDHTKPKNLLCIDRSFLNLYLAKLFFSKSATSFICADVDKNLPIKSQSAELVHIADGFHYLKKKYDVLKEIYRILKKNGNLAIIHTLNISTPKNQYATGTSPKKLKSDSDKAGFKKTCFISNELIWSKLLLQKKLTLTQDHSISDSYAYNMFAAKKALPKQLTFKKKYANLLANSRIDYYQDPILLKVKSYVAKI